MCVAVNVVLWSVIFFQTILFRESTKYSNGERFLEYFIMSYNTLTTAILILTCLVDDHIIGKELFSFFDMVHVNFDNDPPLE